jgi:osmotically-inducible protein OsmY
MVEVKDGKVRVEGKVGSSADVEVVKIGLRNLQDRCISEDCLNTDGIHVGCSSDRAILLNVNYLLSILSCPLSKGVSVSVKNGVATISGRVPDKRYKAYVAQLVESADCVKAGVKNNLVISARKNFSGNCSRLSATVLQKMLTEEVRSRMPCGVAERAGIQVAKGVVTLTGFSSSGHRPKIFNIIRSVCPGFFTEANLLDRLTLVDPSCPIGAKSCTTIDGEPYCCTGCRVCPTY